MKRLSLLRHAKSSWDDPVERDFDRPLNGRGHRAAQQMGRFLHTEGLHFDLCLASPALRIRQTIEGVEAATGDRLPIVWDKRIYLASAATLFEVVAEADDSVGHLLLVGHNPGLEDMVLLATRSQSDDLRRAVEEKYPTATLASLAYDCDSWRAITEDRPGQLVRFVRPRDLDPTLGPDD